MKVDSQVDVSFIVTTYNYSEYIIDSINSCLNQIDSTLSHEVIVVNDGSTDSTAKLLARLNNPKLKIYNIKNSGVEYASNFGIKHAKGRFIVRVDGDDKLERNFLHRIEKISPNNYDIIYGNYTIFDSFNALIGRVKLPVFSREELYSRGDFLATGTVISMDLIKSINYYNIEIKNSGLENYDLIIRLLAVTDKILHVPEFLFYYRKHQRNLSIRKQKEIIKNGQALFKKYKLGEYTIGQYHPWNL